MTNCIENLLIETLQDSNAFNIDISDDSVIVSHPEHSSIAINKNDFLVALCSTAGIDISNINFI